MNNKQVYEETIALFGGGCAICGSKEIQCHHIRYGFGNRKTYMGNVIPLCKYHHDVAHEHKKVWQPLLIDLINERIRESGRNY